MMTREKLLQLGGVLKSMAGLEGVKFAYAVYKNLKVVDAEIEVLKKVMEPSPELIEFEKERIALCESMCDKDANGKPDIVDGVYKGLDNNEAFQAAMADLKAKYKDAIEKRAEQEKQYKALIAEEVDVQLHKIKVSDLPAKISGAQLIALEPILLDVE